MSFFGKEITVKRMGVGAYDDFGFWQKSGADIEFTIIGSIQPRGKNTTKDDNNRRETEDYIIYTKTELFSAEKGNSGNADKVVVNGSDFEVMMVKTWQNNLINHYEIVVAKLVSNGGASD